MRKISVVFWIGLLMAFGKVVSAQVFAPTDGRKIEEPKEYFTGDLTDFQVSPSGKGVACLKYDNNKWVLYWDNINGGRETRVSKTDEGNVVDYRWVGDDALIYSVGEGEIGSELHRYETFSKNYNRLTSTPVRIRFLDAHHYNNGTTLLIREEKDETSTKAYTILPGMRELRHIATGHNVSWIDGVGNGATFYLERTDVGSRFVNCSLNGGEKLGVVKAFCRLEGLAMASKADVYMLSDMNRNNNALVRVNMAEGKELETLFEKKDAMITKVLFSSASRPLVVWYDGPARGFQALDKGFEATLAEMIKKLPTQYGFDIVHSDLTGNVWILSVISSEGSRVYYRYNVANRELKSFGKPAVSGSIEPDVEFIPMLNGDRIRLKIYAPKELNSKSRGVLVFRDESWSLSNEGSIDQLIQRLVKEGLLVVDVDMAYTDFSRKKLIFSGYDQLIDRVIEQIPAIHKVMMTKLNLEEGVVSVIGEGIASRAVIRVSAAHKSLVLRNVLIHPALEFEGYLSSEYPVESDLKSALTVSFQSTHEITLDYFSRSPLLVYAESKGSYFDFNIAPAIESFSKNGSSPESFLIGEGFGTKYSAATVQDLGDKLVEYLRN
jgi:hypothetical protein